MQCTLKIYTLLHDKGAAIFNPYKKVSYAMPCVVVADGAGLGGSASTRAIEWVSWKAGQFKLARLRPQGQRIDRRGCVPIDVTNS